MKILIVSNSMMVGGVRQSLLNFIVYLKKQNYNVELQILKNDDFDSESIHQLKGVKICKPMLLFNVYYTPISKLIRQKKIFRILLKVLLVVLRKIIGAENTIATITFFSRRIKSYDIAISYANDIWYNNVGFSGGCNRYVIRNVDAKRKISWIHAEPKYFGLNHSRGKKTYNKFNYIVNVSYACKKKFDKIIPEYEKKSIVIYNLFDIERINYLSRLGNPYKGYNCFKIVTVARLSNKSKRIDRIINVARKLKDDDINFCWFIVGDGEDREMLIHLTDKNDLNNYVVFLGEQENPYVYMKNADLFVLTSDYESYGMVLVESLITGTPVVTTNYSAASEIVEEGETGYITNKNLDDIYSAIKRLIDNPLLLVKMKANLINNDKYNDIALKQLEQILK